jgi:hypothetical protein
MPLRKSKPESHVLAAAAAQESTMQILKAARHHSQQPDEAGSRSSSSFIEDVDAWVRQYLNLADEALQTPALPEAKDEKKRAA